MSTEQLTPHIYRKPELEKPHPVERQQLISERILDFRKFIADKVGYSEANQAFIDRGLNIALSHEFNKDVDKRSRKFDKEPYIFHPLAMAREAARMRQHPTIVLAALLHDVPEDVKYGTLDSAEKWILHITDTFKDYPDKERLIRILRAELKTESFDRVFDDANKKEVVKYYLDTPLGKTALGYLDSLRKESNSIIGTAAKNGPTEEDLSSIAEVIYDLNRILSESFTPIENGEKEFDATILIVKILDAWQNLQTPGFWRNQLGSEDKIAKTVAKLVRARILTNIAEFLGMRQVGSDMSIAIASIQDKGPTGLNLLESKLYAGVDTGSTDTYLRIRHELKEQLAHCQSLNPLIQEQIKVPENHPQREPRAAYQMAWAPGEDLRVIWYSTCPPEQKGDVDISPISNEVMQNRHEYVTVVTHRLSARSGAVRAAFLEAYGRHAVEYPVLYPLKSAGAPQRIMQGRLRFEETHDGCQRMISTCKAKEFNPAKRRKVPEIRFFHQDICKYVTKTEVDPKKPLTLQKIDTNLTAFMDFMFSPSEFISRQSGEHDVPYIIISNQIVYLATNLTEYTLRQIAESSGLRDPVVHPLEDPDVDYDVKDDDRHVLDELRDQGLLKSHIVVVRERK